MKFPKRTEWRELTFTTSPNKHRQMTMGQSVIVASEICHGYETDDFGTTRRKIYIREFPEPKAGYYVGWTFRQVGRIIPPDNEDPGGLRVEHTFRVARIKFTERSNDSFTVFEDIQ